MELLYSNRVIDWRNLIQGCSQTFIWVDFLDEKWTFLYGIMQFCIMVWGLVACAPPPRIFLKIDPEKVEFSVISVNKNNNF